MCFFFPKMKYICFSLKTEYSQLCSSSVVNTHEYDLVLSYGIMKFINV